jgi:acetyl esterase/lipase
MALPWAARSLPLWGEKTPVILERWSEKQVSVHTPPCFLAHALNDKVVPPANSAQFYASLKAHKVDEKYLELPEGGHGLNGYKGPMWEAWQRQSLEWLAELGLIPERMRLGCPGGKSIQADCVESLRYG